MMRQSADKINLGRGNFFAWETLPGVFVRVYPNQNLKEIYSFRFFIFEGGGPGRG